MSEPKFLIKTMMEKEDYKKFLYIATFRRNTYTIPLVGLITLVGSLIINWNGGYFNFITFFMTWIFMFVLAIGVVCFKMERKNKQRITTDNTGTFGSVNVLKFYDDKVIMENESLKSVGKLRYDQFYQLMESKEYFIFYLTINQASLIRKKDVENVSEFKDFIIGKFDNKFKEL